MSYAVRDDGLGFRAVNSAADVVLGETYYATMPAQTLAQAQVKQVAILSAAYNAAIQVSVSYMGTTFQADSDSVAKVLQVLAAMTPAGATPSGFYWLDATNAKVLMTLAQVQGLAQAIMNQGWTAFQNLQTKKASVNSATTVSGVLAVVW